MARPRRRVERVRAVGESKRMIEDRYKGVGRRGGHAAEYVGETASYLAERIFGTPN